MTIERDDVVTRGGPTYRALAESLADAMMEGRLRAGEKLPPQRDLAFHLGVTVGTVGRAYDLLARRGLVRGEVGRGTYVLGQARSIETAVGELTVDDGLGLTDLTANFPAPIAAQAQLGHLLPTAETAVDVVGDLLRYPEAAGSPRHREAAAAWLRLLDLAVEPDCLVLTNGTEGGLAAALLTVARPGDCILAEALCYSGLRSLAERLGQHLEPVALDGDGMVPDALAAAARHTGARVVVLSPSLHNPTAITMSTERRAALVTVAREHDLLLIEDDVYGPLVPDRPPALIALAPERTLHLTSLSKFLAPGLRLGFLHGPVTIVREVIAVQRALSLGLTPLAAELFLHCQRAGVVVAALREQQAELVVRQRLTAEILSGLEIATQPTALHVWLGLPPPWTSAEAALALARDGVLVAPAERFFIGRGAAPRAVRLSISTPPTRAHLRTALERVARRLTAGTGRSELGSLV